VLNDEGIGAALSVDETAAALGVTRSAPAVAT